MRLSTASLFLAAALVLGPAETRAQDARCFASWSEAAPVVKKEKLVAVEHLSRFAQARLGGRIVKSTLCAIGQRFQYRLVIRPPSGPLRSVALDAHQPLEREGGLAATRR